MIESAIVKAAEDSWPVMMNNPDFCNFDSRGGGERECRPGVYAWLFDELIIIK